MNNITNSNYFSVENTDISSYMYNIQAYYHLLDGHLYEDGGNNIRNNINFLLNNKIIEDDIICGCIINEHNPLNTISKFTHIYENRYYDIIISHYQYMI